MAITNAAFGYSYLLENSNSSFPIVDVPVFGGVPTDGNSEIQAICGFSFQGRSLLEADMGKMLKAKIKKFGSSYNITSLPPLPATTQALETLLPSVVLEFGGLVRFVICDEDGNDLLDTADIVNSADQCPSAGTDLSLIPSLGLRREEIIRGDFVHGFVQKDGYFLTYVIHYPTFYEFFGASGYYSGFGSPGDPPVADYSSQLSKTSILAHAISPEAKSVQSLMAVDLFDNETPWYSEKPSIDSALDAAITNSLELLNDSEANYQNIIFNRNDPAGVNQFGSDLNPCYITGIDGQNNNPWIIDDSILGAGDTNLSTDFHGDIFFREGYNLDLTTADPAITFNAIPGAGYGSGPDCEDSTDKPDGAVRRINSVSPDEVGNVYVGADNCIMVGPVLQAGVPASSPLYPYTPVEAAGSDGGSDPYPGTIRMFNGHPGIEGGTNTLLNRSGGSPGLVINGFCAECCGCENYENVYKALNKVANPVFKDQNDEATDPGIVAKTEKVVRGYECIVNQYNDIVECFQNQPAVVSAAGWGHYGYLVSAQVMIQNHGEEDIKSDLKIEFDLGAVGNIEYVANTSYANVDEDDIDSTDFNPAQPLENLPNSGDSVTITKSGSKITLEGGFLNLSGRTGIRRGRYMMIGLLAYLKEKAGDDACEAGQSYNLTAKVTGLPSGSKNVDTNQYECLSTLFLPTPCTPPIASSLALIDGKLQLKVTGPNNDKNPLDGNSITVNIGYTTDWIEWVPTVGGTADQCGSTISYKYPSVGENNGSVTKVASFTGNVADLGVPPGIPPAAMWAEEVIPSELQVFCTCEDCADEDDDGSVGTCGECQYDYFPKRIIYTVSYTQTTNDSFDCPLTPDPEADKVQVESFTISTPAPADRNPPILYYNCQTPSGATCFEAGSG